jgi:hypothetical protein
MKFENYYTHNRVHGFLLPKSIITWILKCITRPITGYEHKTKINGKHMNRQEQLAETQYQMLVIASDYFRRGATEQKIKQILSYFIKPELH